MSPLSIFGVCFQTSPETSWNHLLSNSGLFWWMLAGSNTRGEVGNSTANSSTLSSTSTNASTHPLTQAPAVTSPTSTCVGAICQTSVSGCDVRGPTTQTGRITVTDDSGKLVPVPCPVYISLWSSDQASKNNASRASATTTIPSDATFATAYPPFIFDHESSMIGGCDVFGAICQTGTIEATLNLTSTVSTTTVACSDYLKAQQAALEMQSGGPYIDRDQWLTRFGRSPQCATFVDRSYRGAGQSGATASYTVSPGETYFNSAYYSSIRSEDFSIAGYTMSGGSLIPPKPTPLAGCPANASEFDENLYPAGIHHHIGAGRDWDCCGWCNLHVPQLQIFYFPDESGVVGSVYNASNATRMKPGFNASAAGKQAAPSPNKPPVTAVVSGYT